MPQYTSLHRLDVFVCVGLPIIPCIWPESVHAVLQQQPVHIALHDQQQHESYHAVHHGHIHAAGAAVRHHQPGSERPTSR